ncbi:hypothetical protein AWH63_10045 [Marinobacter sp. C18]|uniref:hypothetical protein n=1 Tax=Marinobacter sp. C18 TaxID=1772288 RepID=UPI0009491721|nr:hypothetical protein [Marinobacter sp. C18]OLF81875.1 hypothetical protein AWH63_10045 [Marinobacter sp. C18]
MNERLKVGLIICAGIYCAASLILTLIMLMGFSGMSHDFRGEFLIPFETRQWLAPLAGIGFLGFWYWLCSQNSESPNQQTNDD